MGQGLLWQTIISNKQGLRSSKLKSIKKWSTIIPSINPNSTTQIGLGLSDIFL